MLSSKTAAERKRNRAWQCMAIATIDGDGDIPREDHSCILEKLHYGWHLCWCGWRFNEFGVVWIPPRLPLEDPGWAT